MIGDPLDRLGAGIAFLGGAMSPRGRPRHSSRHRRALLSVIYNYNRIRDATQEILGCEFALRRPGATKRGLASGYGIRNALVAELLAGWG